MIAKEALLVTVVKWMARIPLPAPPAHRGRGRPTPYPNRLRVNALGIMLSRRLYTAYSLLAFVEQETDVSVL
jgi:hypothetical protein